MGKFDRVLLASDFDNTLVYTQAALESGFAELPPMPARNREALDYFTKNGGRFVVATGRALPAFAPYAAALPINAPCVIANGAGLYDFSAERYLASALIGEEIREHIAALLAYRPELSFEIYHVDQRIHTMHPNRYILNHAHLTRTEPIEIASFDKVDTPLVKLVFVEEPKVLSALLDFIRAQDWAERYELIPSADFLLELTARGATKGQMVLRLAALLGVAREDVYCIGDHNNDLSMAEVSAVRFAPANAVDELKAMPGMRVVSHCADGAVADVVEVLDKRYG